MDPAAAPGTSVKAALASGSCLVKISDFGLSYRMHEHVTHVSNVRQGTPHYASPEMRKHGRLHKASDVYAMGVIMWEVRSLACPRFLCTRLALHTPAFAHACLC